MQLLIQQMSQLFATTAVIKKSAPTSSKQKKTARYNFISQNLNKLKFPTSVMIKTILEKRLFAGHFQITAFSPSDCSKILEEAYIEGQRLERIFNLYDENSILSNLNKKRKLKVPKEFLEVLNLAIKASKITKGKYDVTLAKNFLNRKSKKPLEKLNCSYKDIKIEKEIVELKHKDILLDFGSLAKGYITDKIGEFLKEEKITEFTINSRGDILVFGEIEHNIEIAHPRKAGEILSKIPIKNSGIATSGDYKQYDKTFNKSHILNNENVSVTVIAKDLTTADLCSTILSVSDKKETKEFLEKNKDISALIVDSNLEVKGYNELKKIKSKKILDGEINDFFSKKTLYPKKDEKDLEEENESDSEEWFIGDGPLDSNKREFFVRPGSKYDDPDLISEAS